MTITVGLAGITGKFGHLLAKHLLRNEDVLLRGYSRNAGKVSPEISSSPRVKLFEGDAFDEAKIAPFVEGCDVVICSYLGDNKLMVDGQKKLIDACEVSNVPRYIASDWAVDYTKLQLGELFPKDPMKHVKAYLETKNTVKGVHILIGCFMDTVFSPFLGLVDVQNNTFKYWGDGTELWESTSYNNAAEFTAKVAIDSSAVGIKKYLGDSKTVKEIAAYYEKVYDIKPTLQHLGSLDELKTRMHALRAEKPAEVLSYMPFYFVYYWLNGSTAVGPNTDNGYYKDVKQETWEDYMRNRTMQQLPGVNVNFGSA
ncbi:hypothetical protein F4810DRAFT_711556 [Camillea tinctor]|nr:hypothetical protein F4810DRAFT_711556 [Camillea tinctor]